MDCCQEATVGAQTYGWVVGSQGSRPPENLTRFRISALSKACRASLIKLHCSTCVNQKLCQIQPSSIANDFSRQWVSFLRNINVCSWTAAMLTNYVFALLYTPKPRWSHELALQQRNSACMHFAALTLLHSSCALFSWPPVRISESESQKFLPLLWFTRN